MPHLSQQLCDARDSSGLGKDSRDRIRMDVTVRSELEKLEEAVKDLSLTHKKEIERAGAKMSPEERENRREVMSAVVSEFQEAYKHAKGYAHRGADENLQARGVSVVTCRVGEGASHLLPLPADGDGRQLADGGAAHGRRLCGRGREDEARGADGRACPGETHLPLATPVAAAAGVSAPPSVPARPSADALRDQRADAGAGHDPRGALEGPRRAQAAG